ncbi:Integrase core domain containing protein [Aphelenchoides avenae]|nr:Integrase core domain containing protein [Aphelenchus avenae]
MLAPAAFAATAGKQQRRPANSAGRLQQRGPANSAVPSAVLNPRANRLTPSEPKLTRDEEKLVDFCQRHNIDWQTITELSPWKGGVYERLIGLVKHCLRRSIGNTKPTVVEFLSLLLCAEHTANCRPLSYVADSSTDFFLVRPIDFLIPMLDQEAHQYPLDPAVDENSPDDPDFIGPGENKLHAKIIKDLTKGRKLADAFWKNFRDGTLLELRNRGIDARRRQFGEETIQPGDLVLVSETDVPRSEWRLALVLELLPHSDGLIRSARIRYASTKRETNRSLEHLYPIGKIPASTTACSATVSRLGLCFTILLSDTSTPPQPTTMSDNLTTTGANEIPNTAALTSSVPISSTTFDDQGQIVLADLPSLAAPRPTQDSAVPANSAGRTVPGSGTTPGAEMQDQPAPPHDPTPAGTTTQQATTGQPLQCDLDSLTEELSHLLDATLTSDAAGAAPGPANSAGRKSPQPAATTSVSLQNLPSIAPPRQPLFDPFELQMSRARQILVGLNERMRIWDGLFVKFRRCIDLQAAGRPVDRNLAALDAELAKRFGTPSSSAAAPRADLQADQDAQVDIDIAHQEAQADADDIQQAVHEAWLQDQEAYWNDVKLTGTPIQEENPFLQEVTTEEEADPTEEADPLVARPDPANSAGTVPALRAPANQVPFNGKALLRSKPIAMDLPPYPSLAEIERRVRQFFAPLPEGTPPVLEPIDESTLYSSPAEQAQKLSFVVNRSSLAPIPTTWDPLVLCNGDGEQDCFHRCLRRLRIIQSSRWITGHLKRDAQLNADMQALLERFVPSFGHMILLSYAVRMFNKNSNVYAYVDFLTRMLDCTDFDEDLPKLLAERQPYLAVGGTRDPWPTPQDLRTAAKRWLGYCQHAYKDIFTRLSGPIIWSPEWMLSKDLPSDARKAFDKMATTAAAQLDIVRQMVYRQYGLKHVQAIRSDTAYEWLPLDNFSDRDLMDENGLLAQNKTICFVDKYSDHDFGAALHPRTRFHLVSETDCAKMLDHIMDLYPSHEVDRIIWWFGTEYMVDYGQDDYGTVVAFLSHHFAAYFGYPEQIVIAPPYAHSRCDTWSKNVLGLLAQKEVLLPHARLIIAPHDLQVWRRDYFPTATAEADETWPSIHLTEDGLLKDPHIAELRKYQLRKYHGLDLWTYYEAFTPTAPMPQAILDRTNTGGPNGDFTEPGIVKVAANSAASATPSTSTSSTTEATANSAVAEAPAPPSTSATIAEQNLRAQDCRAATDAAPRTENPARPDAATSSSADAPAIAAPTANQAATATVADVETRIAPLAADVAEMKDTLLQIKAALLGPRSPTTPDPTPRT